MRPLRRTALVGAAVLLAAVGLQIVGAGGASAHTPDASITCTTWSIGATNYEAAQNNTYSYSIDGGPTHAGSFQTAFTESGTFPANSGNHTLDGHVWQNNDPNATYSKDYHLSTTSCASVVEVALPAAPSATPPTCDANGVLTVSPPGAHVSVDQQPAGSGPGDYTITYTTDSGYTFPGGDTSKTYTITVLPKGSSLDCRSVVTPVAPTVTQASCDHTTGNSSGFTITLANTPGIIYSVKDLVVTATANSGDKLGTLPAGWTSVSDTVATYTVTKDSQPCLVDVAPVAPALTQSVCTGPGTASTPTVTPVDTSGITYAVATDLSTVTATPNSGYEFTQPLPAGWMKSGDAAVFTVHLVPAGNCLVDVAPAAPALAQSVCQAGTTTPTLPTLTIAATPNVSYTVTAGPYHAGDKVVVTATAAKGYQFSKAGLPSGWTLGSSGTATFPVSFAAAPACAQAVAASFTNAVCTATGASGASYTLPPITGVDYYVNGVKSAPGTFPVHGDITVTVAVKAQAGYTLTGTTTWSHKFGTPTCAQVSSKTITQLPHSKTVAAAPTSNSPLASTGVPTLYLLLLGGLAALGGAAMYLGGIDRRWFRS